MGQWDKMQLDFLKAEKSVGSAKSLRGDGELPSARSLSTVSIATSAIINTFSYPQLCMWSVHRHLVTLGFMSWVRRVMRITNVSSINIHTGKALSSRVKVLARVVN